MKASVFRGPEAELAVEDVEVSAVGPRELLVQTAAAGLCHSDLYHLRGVFELPMPTVLGHESAGVVVEVGSDVTDFAPGDHVITCLAPFCGKCSLCLTGRSYLCAGQHSVRAVGSLPVCIRATQRSISSSMCPVSPSSCSCTRPQRFASTPRCPWTLRH